MNDTVTAIDPAALRDLGLQLTKVAGGIPQRRPEAGSVADPAADTVLQEFITGWSSYLQDLGQVVERSAQQARLTALAFELVDWR